MSSHRTTLAGIVDTFGEARDREIVSLNGLLKQPLTKDILARWAHQSPVREGILRRTLWGSIVWRRGLGHPTAVPFATAFVVEREAWQSELDYEGGVHEVDLLKPQPPVSTWDGPHDDEYYRVSFLASVMPGQTRVQVSMVPGVAWTRAPGLLVVFREVEPPVRHYDTATGWVVLDPFEVVRRFV